MSDTNLPLQLAEAHSQIAQLSEQIETLQKLKASDFENANKLREACRALRQQVKEADGYAGNWETAGEHIATVCAMVIRGADEMSQQDFGDAARLIAHLCRFVRDPRTSVRDIPF